MSERNGGETILAFVLGGVIGAALGVLFAPRPGKETRGKLKEWMEEMGEDGGEAIQKVKEKAESLWAEGREKISAKKEQIQSAVAAGRRAYQEVAEKEGIGRAMENRTLR